MNKEPDGTVFKCAYSFREGEGKISLEGFEVLRVAFDPENFAKGLFDGVKQSERFAQLPEEQRRKLYENVQEHFAKEGVEVSDEQIKSIEEKAIIELELEFIEKSVEIATNMVSGKFQEFVIAFWEKLLNVASFTGANALRDLFKVPEMKYSTKAMETAMHKLERERLKTLIGATTTHGGARNVKHLWTDDERACLATKYEELQPIWIEAKRIAKAAQKSKERTRSKEWRAEVLRAYPQLPSDLLERFSNPRADDAKPADIAVIHAKRECGITEDYTPRRLREQIKAWKLKTSS